MYIRAGISGERVVFACDVLAVIMGKSDLPALLLPSQQLDEGSTRGLHDDSGVTARTCENPDNVHTTARRGEVVFWWFPSKCSTDPELLWLMRVI